MIGLTTVILAGCQKQEVLTDVPVPQPLPTPEPEKDYVLADLALSLPSSYAGTRLSQAVVQDDKIAFDSLFRGIQKLTLLPFFKKGKIEEDDLPTYYEIGELKQNYTAIGTQQNYLYYEKFYLKHDVSSFLTYGQASRTNPALPTGITAKGFYGSLLTKIDGVTKEEGVPGDLSATPANLTFELEPIYKETNAHDYAKAIAAYMTHIANSKATIGETEYTWKNAANGELANLYQDFIGHVNEKYLIISGSAANVKAYVNFYYTKIKTFRDGLDTGTDAGAIAAAIADAIMNSIVFYQYPESTGSILFVIKDENNKVTSLNTCDEYPDNLYLPAGAAALRWGVKEEGSTEYEFKPETQTSTVADVNNINCYVYPAELYYYDNSTIKTSNEEVVPPFSQTTWENWENLVAANYPGEDNDHVTSSTQSVAIVKPMQYAVAQLKAKVLKTESSLKDAEGTSVTVGETSFPITGLIVGGQYPVKYDFTSKYDGAEDEVEKFVYDAYLGDAGLYLTTQDGGTPWFHTLLLQNRDNEKVVILLELKNNSGADFYGKNGIVFAGTKFYLLGEVKLSDASNTGTEDFQKRVFTQDYVTELTMQVNTLANALNVMPNLQKGRLEVSVQINLKWTQAKPTTIEFEE